MTYLLTGSKTFVLYKLDDEFKVESLDDSVVDKSVESSKSPSYSSISSFNPESSVTSNGI